jgi:hypothetical protein
MLKTNLIGLSTDEAIVEIITDVHAGAINTEEIAALWIGAAKIANEMIRTAETDKKVNVSLVPTETLSRGIKMTKSC